VGALAARWRFRALGLLVAFAWGWFWTDQALDNRLPAGIDTATLEGVVTGLPRHYEDAVEFRFRPDHIDNRAWPHGLVRARWYRQPPDIRPGDRWQLQVRLAPPAGRVNFTGGDVERAWFAQRVTALASVRDGQVLPRVENGFHLHRFRDRLRRALSAELAGHPGLGLVLALSVADRGQLDAGLRDALAVTGTGHLLAVSGLHVGLVALFGFGVGRLLSWAWPAILYRWPAVGLNWVFAITLATGYAALAGFSTSTRRALIMLIAWGLCRLLRRRVSPWRPWWLALGAVFMLDPLSLARAGFWMSFGAVAVLVFMFSTRHPRPGRLSALVLAQTGIALVMLPLGLAWFGMAGGGGWFVNLLAIPWVSFINLPLILVGVGAWWLDAPFGEVALYMAADASSWLELGLQFAAGHLSALAGEWPQPGVPAVVLATLGALVLVAPRGMPMRWAGCFLLLPLFLPTGKDLAEGEWRLELLDVGQGLAALVETRDHLLLYDTGPGQPGTWDLHEAVLAPALRGRASPPEWLLLSHGDLDHAGGLGSVRGDWPRLHLIGNRKVGVPNDMAACHDERYWQWNGVRFDVLHPGRWLPYLGNDSSCVLAVDGAGGRLLLPGDIGHRVERRLVSRETGDFGVVVAPHHGSRHSTTTGFLRWAAPEFVLAATGIGNRFGFPHPDVRSRVNGSGAQLLDTAACGAIRVELRKDGQMRLSSARRSRHAPWRWPAGEACP